MKMFRERNHSCVCRASDTLGIDKGISLLMIANYESEIIWDLFMRNENVQVGIDVLGFTDVEQSEAE